MSAAVVVWEKSRECDAGCMRQYLTYDEIAVKKEQLAEELEINVAEV